MIGMSTRRAVRFGPYAARTRGPGTFAKLRGSALGSRTRRSRVKLPTLRRTIRVASLHDLDVHLRPNKGRAATSGLFYREIYSDVAFGRWQSTSARRAISSEEHTSELQSLMRTSYAV